MGNSNTFFRARADDALDAKKMNVSDGGKQPFMRDGFYREGETVIPQSMQFKHGPKKGKQKGLKTVLAERYGDDFVKGLQSIEKKTDPGLLNINFYI